jgi:hypothetical protein
MQADVNGSASGGQGDFVTGVIVASGDIKGDAAWPVVLDRNASLAVTGAVRLKLLQVMKAPLLALAFGSGVRVRVLSCAISVRCLEVFHHAPDTEADVTVIIGVKNDDVGFLGSGSG